MRQAAARGVLAADRLGAGVIVDVLGAVAVFGGERLDAALRACAPGAGGDGPLARDGGEVAGGVVGEALAARGGNGVGLRARVAV